MLQDFGKVDPWIYASGPTWGPTKQNLRKSRFLERFCLEFHWLMHSHNDEGPAAVRTQICAALPCG